MDKIIKIALLAVIAIFAIIFVVGVVVVLGAVVAAFVFSTSSSTSTSLDRPYNVGITAMMNASGYITIQTLGGSDLDKLQSVEVTYKSKGSDSRVKYPECDDLDKLLVTGGKLTIPPDAGTPNDPSDDPATLPDINVIGHFSDGRDQVLVQM